MTTRNQKKADRLSFAYDDLEQRIEDLSQREALDAMRPDLNGDQIMQILGVGPSRVVGQAYQFLLDLRMEHGPLGEQEATKRLLETDNLSEMKEVLGEAAKAVSTFEKSVAKTLSDAENAPLAPVKPDEGGGTSTTPIALPSSTQVTVSSTAAVSSSSEAVVPPTTPTSSAPGGT